MSDYISNGSIGPLWLKRINRGSSKGGIWIDKKRGYVSVWRPDHHFANKYGYIIYHRVVYESFHRCVLMPWVDVHHIDHNPRNNFPDNLDVMIGTDHDSYHSRGRVPWNKDTQGMMPTPWNKDMKGLIPWNKGLKGVQAGENHPSWGKKRTEETKSKLREAWKRRKLRSSQAD